MIESVKQYHHDLAERFKLHGSQFEQKWKSFDQRQRETILRGGAREGRVLRTPQDKSLGSIHKFIPEWNLRDLTSPSSEFLINMLKYRATASLQEQYMTGVNGDFGDHEHIIDMMAKKNLHNKYSSKYRNCYILFTADSYGQPIELTPDKYEAFLMTTMQGFRAEQLVSRVTGDMILLRQQCLLQALNIVVHDVLRTRDRPEKPTVPATVALPEPPLRSPPKEEDLSDLVDGALDRKSSLEDYLNLLRTEPTVLVHEVNLWFSTQPELVVDEKGRKQPVHTNEHISGALLDAVHGIVKTAAVWSYISRLVALLKESPNKQSRAVVLQELSNTCNLEYKRAQSMFKRTVSTMSGGSKWFKRISTLRSDGVVRISLKRNPESLAEDNPQLHYMLRLCQDETTWAKSAEWLQKLDHLHRSHPKERVKVAEEEFNALGDLAIIVTFIQSLSSVVKIPTVSNKNSQSFASGFSALEYELRQLKTELDLSEFAVPIDNMLKPDMASGALTTLDEYILETTGTKLGFLYHNLIEESVANISKQYEQRKSKACKATKECITSVVTGSPSQPPIHDINPEAEAATSLSGASLSDKDFPRPRQKFTVKPSTRAVFSSLLDSSPTPNKSVSWDAFAAAMTDLGFSVITKFGSIYTFVPPETFNVQRNITLHQPQQSHIKGRCLLLYSCRLKHVYGWDDETFVMA